MLIANIYVHFKNHDSHLECTKKCEIRFRVRSSNFGGFQSRNQVICTSPLGLIASRQQLGQRDPNAEYYVPFGFGWLVLVVHVHY